MLLLLLATSLPVFAAPPTAASLAATDGPVGAALARYLAEPGAHPRVCDRSGAGPSIPGIDEAGVRALLAAAKSGKVPAPTAKACLGALLRDPRAAYLTGNELVLVSADAGTRGGEGADMLLGVLADRPADCRLDRDLVKRTLARIDTKLARAGLEADERARLLRLHRAIELEAGLIDGAAATEAAITAEDEVSRLAAMAARLPEARLREVAALRLRDLRIAASPFAVVRDAPDAVRRALDEGGAYAVDVARHPVVAARWVPGPQEPSIVRLIQAAETGRSHLLAVLPDRTVRTDASIPLRPALAVELQGVERPLALCGEGDRWDPTPCVAPTVLALDHPGAQLDGDKLRLRDDLVVDDVVLLGRDGERFLPRLMVGGVAATGLDLVLHFDPVAPLVLSGTGASRPGPDLRVDLVEIGNGRLFFGVQVLETSTRYAVVTARHDEGFQVVSRGVRGQDGQPGRDGTRGTDGSRGASGSCPSGNGGNGGNGGPGGAGTAGSPGGDGGNGGNITVVLDCEDCEALRPIALRRVASQGGAAGEGGAGGKGGTGGKGGPGGNAASCSTYDAASKSYRSSYGTSGMSGTDGAAGASGSRGADGRPGTDGSVSVRLRGQ